MLKIAKEPTFRHQVTARVPIDGGHEDQQFSVTFRVLPVSVMDGARLEEVGGTGAFLQQAIVGLDDIVDEAGKPVAWSDALRDRVIDTPFLRQALIRAYFDGVAGAAAGN
jgi:hypothetical protein